jgi:carboxyl-terminal processing protease
MGIKHEKNMMQSAGLRRRVIVLAAAVMLSMITADGQMFNENTFKIGRLLGLVENFYVDSVNMTEITDKAIIELLRSLDPHSAYIPADEVEEANEPLQGNFEGIGVQFNMLNDTILVISPVPGGPSEKVGILPGDRIITINDENVAGTGITTTGVRNRLMGEKGTIVRVGIFRKGVSGLNEYTIIRDKIPVNSLDAAYMLDAENGYLKLNRFSATTESEFFAAVKTLVSQGMENLIIDLRGNTGGYMAPAVTLTDAFLPRNRMIVYLEGQNTPRQEFISKGSGILQNARVAVLTDEGSASASEILAGALQDWDRGLIVGRRTFGKGLVQNGYYLTDGSMIRLTIARYYTPSGRSIQSPYDDGYDKYMENFMKRYASGEMVSADSIHFPDSLQAKTLVTKRTVYGGGGIVPDMFVSADTSGYSDYYRDVIRSGTVTQFTLGYVDTNRERLKRNFLTFEDFRKSFSFSGADLREFIRQAEKAGISYNEEQFRISEAELVKIMKGLVARDLWDMSEYYRIVNEGDNVIRRALEAIADSNRYNELLGY